MFQENQIEKKEKPEILYIATQTKGIKEFIPRRGNVRSDEEGAVIFSTPNKELASMFLINGHEDSWTRIAYLGGVPYVVICMNREEFIEKDKGGVMYEVPSDTFDFNPNLGMGEKEWTSRVPVKPIMETTYSSSLDTMIQNGVNVYFVDKPTFDAINNSADHGFEILLTLTSENKRIGKVLRPLEDLRK